MKRINAFIKDNRALVVVEATILFPVIFMVFFAMMLLSMYLPQRTILQEAAQYAVSMLVPERSDTAYSFDDSKMEIPKNWDFQMQRQRKN